LASVILAGAFFARFYGCDFFGFLILGCGEKLRLSFWQVCGCGFVAVTKSELKKCRFL
jgi:hypothetical protein